MVCLNEKLPINLAQMKKNIIYELDSIIEHNLYYLDEIDEEKKTKIKNSITKEFKNKINTDLFIYRIMDDNYCTFKHNRGKHDGEFCCRRITINGDKKKYLCRVHNKDHVPNKKIQINNFNKNISIEKSIQLMNIDKIDKIDKKPDILIKDSINNIKNMKHKHIHVSLKHTSNIINNKIINKRYIKNTNINILKNYLNLYNNIICKYKKNSTCYNIKNYGCCNFTHIDNEIPITDFLYNNNFNIKIDAY
jgi:hypothetical protein